MTDETTDAEMNQRTTRLLVRVAELYYLQDRTQAQIAQALQVSRPHISRLLRRGRQAGLVTISVRSAFARTSPLADEIQKVVPLRDVMVVPHGADPLARVAEAAA